ncbi:MAG: Eco57I restriction-modification methylase domain-containing protein [Bacteroidetes bacterium]|nr:Eco57I restriction-modification methylase domain-containing protein [Bacteroidota bacterium]
MEHQFSQINIADEAFKKIFDFFDQWNWHLDNSIEATGRDINPDVIGYIFEKYINDRAEMGAYYTKEDITDYIGKNTIIPFLFDETARNCKEPFKSNGEIWSYIKNSGDDYIFDAVKYGIRKNGDILSDLPKEIQEGFNDNLEKQLVNAVSKSHLWEIRKTWNQPAPKDIALPTELYRELIDRRKRYNEINTKISNGEIKSINDFISYNINIRQFTQDFIESTPDANFVEHFYKAINKITILDPTCGSGAFLFAALNILEPMYEACIIRMEQFTSEQPAKYKFFEKTLEDVKSEKHPNLQYYIYKSIILNNLYGVDIMKEAVEIAKLRLFLKLVACVDVNPRKENFGLEPLPDVDFNIRSGNTLIGFATEKEMLETIRKTEPMFAEAKVEDFKEEFELVGKAFSHFQNNQLINDQGSDSFKKAKADLSARLKELNQKLNEYLSSNYGITDLEKNVEIEITTDKGKKTKKKINQFQYWLSSHKPFHWFAEFYKIVAADGGFDVIIGNPPYVVYTEEKSEYILKDYTTLSCSNLYAYCTERSFSLLHSRGKFGFIIPNSSISAGKLSPLQAILKTNKSSWISNYSWRPGKLFDGANMLLAIIISDCNTKDQLYSSQYYKWYNDYRPDLFQNISYTSVLDFIIEGSIPKVPNEFAKRLLQKTNSSSFNIEYFKSNSATRNMIYYFRAVLYWVKILDKIPVFKEDGVNKVTGEMKPLYFDSSEKKYVFGGLLSSSLFFLNYIVWSSCQVINSRDFDLKFDFNKLSSPAKKKLVQLGEELQSDFQENSKIVVRNYSTKGREFQMKKQYFYIKKSKNIIDQIDTVLAEYYGFTEEELDFIINYDIKYRMKILLSDVDIEEDEED